MRAKLTSLWEIGLAQPAPTGAVALVCIALPARTAWLQRNLRLELNGDGTNFVVTVPLPTGNKFYRLREPGNRDLGESLVARGLDRGLQPTTNFSPPMKRSPMRSGSKQHPATTPLRPTVAGGPQVPPPSTGMKGARAEERTRL